MASLNRVLLIGNLTRDPELRYIPSGSAVADFGVAMNRRFKRQDGSWQEETTFVDVSAWGSQGEFVKKYFSKGKSIFVEGRLKYDQWTTPEGQKRSKLTVVAESIQFVEPRQDGGDEGGGQRGARGFQQSRQGAGTGGYNSGDDFGRGHEGPGFGGPLTDDGPDEVPF